MQHTVVMGVCGCGKSTVAQALANHFNSRFIEADELHSVENVDRMQRGQALNDSDRWPWLRRVSEVVNQSNTSVFVSCSALRRSYRDFLRLHIAEPVFFIHLDGAKELLSARMAGRENHFMPQTLLDSQLQTLEPIQGDEAGMQVDIRLSVHEMVETITNAKNFEKLIRI